MSQEAGTLNLTPTGYDADNSSYKSIQSGYPIANSYTDSSSTSHTRILCKYNANVESWISYTFTFELPNNTIINSVTCLAKSRVNNTEYLPTAVMQLYSGSTPKGDTTDFCSTSAEARSVGANATWTVSEVRNIELRLTVKRGTSSVTRDATFYFYGADLTINYTIDDTLHDAIHVKVNGDWKEVGKVYTKTNGTWEEVSKVSKKENGSWDEKDSLAIFDANAIFLKGT